MAYEYPLTFVESNGKNFNQFIIPVVINGSTCFGLIDTGASISTISYQVALELGFSPDELTPDGEATFVGGFPYYYTSVESSVKVLPPNEQVLDDIWAINYNSSLSITNYYEEMTPAMSISEVPLRILTKPMSSFAREANWDHPELQSRTKSMPPMAILGVEGFLDSIMLETAGSDVFRLSPLTED